MQQQYATGIMPFLTVNDGKKAVEFYVSALGANELARFTRAGGAITAQIGIGGAEFWVGDEEPEFGNIGPVPGSNNPVRIILRIAHAEELFEKAIQHGAEEICPMTTETDWRIGKLKDPFGHVWEIGHPL